MLDMLKCEGYKMYRGALLVTPKNSMPPMVEQGVCLYKPEYDCWYVNCRSYPADVCTVVVDEKDSGDYRPWKEESPLYEKDDWGEED